MVAAIGAHALTAVQARKVPSRRGTPLCKMWEARFARETAAPTGYGDRHSGLFGFAFESNEHADIQPSTILPGSHQHRRSPWLQRVDGENAHKKSAKVRTQAGARGP